MRFNVKTGRLQRGNKSRFAKIPSLDKAIGWWSGGSSGVAALALTSATITSSGSDTLLTLVFSEAAKAGAGGFYGWTLNPSGGFSGVTYVSGFGTDTWIFLTQRPIAQGETALLDFDQEGDGIQTADDGTDLASFSGFVVTNQSTYSALLVFDQFITADAAPLTSPRICEPGPGEWLATETAGGATISITGGEGVMSRPTSGQAYAAHNLVASLAGAVRIFTRKPGLVFYGKVKAAVIAQFAPPHLSYAPTNGGTTDFTFQSAAQIYVFEVSGALGVGESLSLNTYYQTAIVLRGNGAFMFIRGGSQYPNWTLIWIKEMGNQEKMYAWFSNFNSGPITFDDFTVKQLAGPFADEYGIATGFDAVINDGDVAVCDADGIQCATWTPISAEVKDILQIRRTDDNNCWIIRGDQAASTIKLFDKIAGVETERATSAQTWTVGTPVRIFARHVGANIRSFTAIGVVAPVAKHNYATASFNQTATGAKISNGAGMANWERYAWNFSGNALDDLAPSGATVSLAPDPNRFVLITDPHLHGPVKTAGIDPTLDFEGAAMARYINALRPSGVFVNGDCGENFSLADTTNFWTWFWNLIRGRKKLNRGNHDANTDSGTNPAAISYSNFDSIFSANAFPYNVTMDWEAPKIRFISAHADIRPTGQADAGLSTITADTRNWVQAEIDALPVGYKAAILTHPPGNNSIYGNGISLNFGGTEWLALLAANAAKIAFYGFGHRHNVPVSHVENGVRHILLGMGSHYGAIGSGIVNLMIYRPGTNDIEFRLFAGRAPYERLPRSVWPHPAWNANPAWNPAVISL